jgi:hypothetical protein
MPNGSPVPRVQRRSTTRRAEQCWLWRETAGGLERRPLGQLDVLLVVSQVVDLDPLHRRSVPHTYSGGIQHGDLYTPTEHEGRIGRMNDRGPAAQIRACEVVRRFWWPRRPNQQSQPRARQPTYMTSEGDPARAAAIPHRAGVLPLNQAMNDFVSGGPRRTKKTVANTE